MKGLMGELEFSLYLIKNGWNVYKPIDQNSRADLVIEKEGNFRRVQVKYCTPYKGCLRVEMDHPMRKTQSYSSDEIDDIGAFDPINKKLYLIPISDIVPRKQIWIRVDKTKNSQRKNINLGEKYLLE